MKSVVRGSGLGLGLLLGAMSAHAAPGQQTAPGAGYPPPVAGTTPIRPAPPAIEAMLPRAGEEDARAKAPEQAVRYDEVGLASPRTGSTRPGAVAWHASLAAGSHVEVTSLNTGRTIVLAIGGTGTTAPGRLIELSDSAVDQLALDPVKPSPVRVREVTPTAGDRATLRAGGAAPTRLDAPEILLKALRKRLGSQPPAAAPPKLAAPKPSGPAASPPLKPSEPTAPPPPKPPATKQAAQNKPVAAAGRYRVQVAALSNRARADTLARSLSGSVVPAGRLFRVHLGPFATAGEAKAARDAAARRGYADAQVVTD